MLILDLSSYVPASEIDWRAVRAFGVRGFFVKLTEGLTWVNPEWGLLATGAAKEGILVGGYHFAHPEDSAEESAKRFVAELRRSRIFKLRPLLDFERPTHPVDDWRWCHVFNQTVFKSGQPLPVFYTYEDLIKTARWSKPLGAALVLANYGTEMRNLGAPWPWTKAQAHQFTSEARIPGLPGGQDLSYAANPASLYASPGRRALSRLKLCSR